MSFSLDNAANTDSALANTIAGQLFWQPQEEDLVVTNLASNETIKINADALSAGTQNVEAPARINEDGAGELIARLESRKTIYTMDVEVESDSLRISFYDNGDVDGDSISVFIDKKPVLVKQELTARALNIYVKLDSTKAVNEVTMFAENLGTYPPNTALMVITDGVKRHEVYLSSSLTQNAGIRLKRKKK